MKHLIIAAAISLLALLSLHGNDADSSFEVRSRRSLDLLREFAKGGDGLEPADFTRKLGYGLMQTSDESLYPHPDRLEVRGMIQKTLLSTPGHAEFFASGIRSAYFSHKEASMNHGSAENLAGYHRAWFHNGQVLANLPGPETVRVLGDMLDEDWEDPMNKRRGTLDKVGKLSVGCMGTLGRLPWVRDAKLAPPAGWGTEEDLQQWRAWYAEVKAGSRSFAFIGQPVSYRFRPDGTVEATPRDASADPPEFPQRPAAMETPPAAAEKKPPQFPSATGWWWATGIVALGTVAFLRRLSRKRPAIEQGGGGG